MRDRLAKQALRDQAKSVRVQATCSCGCRSVVLQVDPVLPVAKFSRAETGTGRTDVVALSATQTSARSTTDVTLHVVDGRLAELEIWAGEGMRPRVRVAKLRRWPPPRKRRSK
ncbi:MAG: hypothetical protein AB7O24_26695 [Kofleriaceae bacterium]